jgi:O-antigen ligase
VSDRFALPRPAFGPAALVVGLAVGAALMVTAMTAVAARFDERAPIILIALPLVLALLLGIVHTPRMAIAAIFALFPIAYIVIPSPTMRLALIGIGVLLMLARVTAGRAPLEWAPPLTWGVALFSWMLFDLSTTIRPDISIREMIAFVSGLVVVVVVLSACRNLDDARWALGVFLAVATVIALEAQGKTSGPLQSQGGGTVVAGRLQGYFGSPNQLGSFCALAIFVAVGLVFGARTRRGRILAAATLPMLLLGLTLSFSRGAWIGSVLAFLFVLYRLREARRAVVLVGVPLIAIAAFSGSFSSGGTQVQVVTQRIGAISATSPYDHRGDIWHEAIREIKESPWRGQGPGTFPVASLRAASSISRVYAEHAHDIWLTWAAEDGLPGAALLFGLVVAVGMGAARAARGARERQDRRDLALIVGLEGALISVVGQGLVDYTLRNAVIFAAISAMIGMVLVARREALRPAPAPVIVDAEAEYDLSTSEQLIEQRERRLAAQSEALRARRRRLAEFRRALEERERALDQAAVRSLPADHQKTLESLETRESALAEQERLLAERRAELDAAAQRERDLARRERELAFRAAALEARELERAEAAAAVPVAAPEPVHVVEPEPEPEPAAPIVVEPTPTPAPTEYGSFTLARLEQLVNANAGTYPDRVEEWRYYLFYLRGYADVDERLPSQFDGLVADVFAELVD